MGPNYDIVKELQNINKNLQSINMAFVKEKRSDDETVNHNDVMNICRTCPFRKYTLRIMREKENE